jgi:hypothetical protein
VKDTQTTGGRWSPEEAEKHINELELEAVHFALKSLCQNIYTKHIRVRSDNTTAVCYINNMGGSKSRACNAVAKNKWSWAVEKGNWLSAAHLPGKYNIIALTLIYLHHDSINKLIHMPHGNQTLVPLLLMHLQCHGITKCSTHFLLLLLLIDAYRGDSCTNVANSDILPKVNGNADQLTKTTTNAGKSAKVTTLRGESSIMEKDATDGMSYIWKNLEARGVPEEARNIMLQFWRKSTRNQYDVYLKKWTLFCCERDINPHETTINVVLQFLTSLYESGLRYSAINTARCALSIFRLWKYTHHWKPPSNLQIFKRGLSV